MKKILKNKILYYLIFIFFLLLFIPSKQELIEVSINNKLNLFDKHYDADKNLNTYLIKYYSQKKNLNKKLTTDYYYLLNLNLPGLSNEQIFYKKKKINVKKLNDHENVLITKNCQKYLTEKIFVKKYKLIKKINKSCFFEKN